jgi:hypothetical protein
MAAPTPKFKGRVSDAGELSINEIVRFKQFLLGLRGKEVSVVVKRYSKGRSNQQNRYYFGVVVAMLADFTGYGIDEMHEALKQQFLRVESETRFNITKSTAELATVEMEEYLSSIRSWASVELGVYIPKPDEIDF